MEAVRRPQATAFTRQATPMSDRDTASRGETQSNEPGRPPPPRRNSPHGPTRVSRRSGSRHSTEDRGQRPLHTLDCPFIDAHEARGNINRIVPSQRPKCRDVQDYRLHIETACRHVLDFDGVA